MNIYSFRRARAAGTRPLPNIAFVIFHTMLVQQRQEFVLE